MRIIGIIIWVMGALYALGWGLIIRQKAKNEQATEHTFELHALLLAISVIIVPAMSLSPFHLLWMMPASFILSLASIIFPLNLLWMPASLYGSLWYIGVRNPALALYRNGEYAEAIDAFKESIRRNPRSSENYFFLALAYDKLGDYENAINFYQECIRLKPDSVEAYCNLALAFQEVGDNRSAIEAFSNAIRIKPKHSKAIANLGMIYIELGEFNNAGKQWALLNSVDRTLADELYAAITEAEKFHTQTP